MSKKHRGGPGPVPPGNQSRMGPQHSDRPAGDEELAQKGPEGTSGAAGQEQDPKRRLGNYQTAGEHAFQQPGGKNDANH